MSFSSCGHRRTRREVLVDVRARAVEALLLAGPEADADRAARLHVQGLQDPHDFHRDDRAGAVVRRARAAVPRVEVGADHHDLVLLVGARDLGDRVPLHLVFVDERGLHVELELHGDVAVEQPGDAPEVLRLHREPRRRRHGLGLLVLAAALHVERPEVAPAEIDHGQRLLLEQERLGRPAQLGAFHVLGAVVARRAARASRTSRSPRAPCRRSATDPASRAA